MSAARAAHATHPPRVAPLLTGLVALAAACASPTPPPVRHTPTAEDAVEGHDSVAFAAPPRREIPLGEVRIPPADAPDALASSARNAEMRAQLFAALQSMRGCWSARGARLAVDLVVGVSGSVVDARVRGDDEVAALCVQNALIGWRYVGTGEALHVTATLVGEPGARLRAP